MGAGADFNDVCNIQSALHHLYGSDSANVPISKSPNVVTECSRQHDSYHKAFETRPVPHISTDSTQSSPSSDASGSTVFSLSDIECDSSCDNPQIQSSGDPSRQSENDLSDVTTGVKSKCEALDHFGTTAKQLHFPMSECASSHNHTNEFSLTSDQDHDSTELNDVKEEVSKGIQTKHMNGVSLACMNPAEEVKNLQDRIDLLRKERDSLREDIAEILQTRGTEVLERKHKVELEGIRSAAEKVTIDAEERVNHLEMELAKLKEELDKMREESVSNRNDGFKWKESFYSLVHKLSVVEQSNLWRSIDNNDMCQTIVDSKGVGRESAEPVFRDNIRHMTSPTRSNEIHSRREILSQELSSTSTNEVEQLRESLSTLEKSLMQLKLENACLRGSNGQLKEQVQLQRQELDVLKCPGVDSSAIRQEDWDRLREDYSEMQKNYGHLQQEMNALQKDMRVVESERCHAVKRCDELENVATEATEECERLLAQLADKERNWQGVQEEKERECTKLSCELKEARKQCEIDSKQAYVKLDEQSVVLQNLRKEYEALIILSNEDKAELKELKDYVGAMVESQNRYMKKESVPSTHFNETLNSHLNSNTPSKVSQEGENMKEKVGSYEEVSSSTSAIHCVHGSKYNNSNQSSVRSSPVKTAERQSTQIYHFTRSPTSFAPNRSCLSNEVINRRTERLEKLSLRAQTCAKETEASFEKLETSLQPSSTLEAKCTKRLNSRSFEDEIMMILNSCKLQGTMKG